MFKSISNFDLVPLGPLPIEKPCDYKVGITRANSWCSCRRRVKASRYGIILPHDPGGPYLCAQAGAPVQNIELRCKLCNSWYFQKLEDGFATRHPKSGDGVWCSAWSRTEVKITKVDILYEIVWRII